MSIKGILISTIGLISTVGCARARLDEKGYVSAVISVASRSGDSTMFRNRMQDSMLRGFPVLYDWWLQDGGKNDLFTMPLRDAIASRIGAVCEDLDRPTPELRGKSNEELFDIYHDLCIKRRGIRLKDMPDKIVFTKFKSLRPSVFSATEGLSDARGERNFYNGGEMATLRMRGKWAEEQLLIRSDSGMVRDPDIDYGGSKLLFAWKKSSKDDYHLYEMDLYTQAIRKITSQDGYADYEGRYLPDGNILFASTRAAISTGDAPAEVSNFFICDGDGRYMRRVGFDQSHTLSPSVMDDGRVIYTRADHNDRGNVFAQPLFTMNCDGTSQSAYYGMYGRFPTTVIHSRQIPGTERVMAVLTGYHSPQHGKLAIIDVERGRNGDEGIMLAAPMRKVSDTDRRGADTYGQFGDQFQHPFPLDEDSFLVSYSPLGYDTGEPRFGIYWMNTDGDRELLASDRELSCNQPVVIASRKKPRLRSSRVDYKKETGRYMMQDIYAGSSLKGIERGTVKKLRIVELIFRNTGIGKQMASGPGGSSVVTTPVGTAGASWDVKRVLGTVEVMADGSAYFEVPARTPLYFQALDSLDRVVATMRSWSTLQPGEEQGCVGCHESHNTTPLTASLRPVAVMRPVDTVRPETHLMPEKGFSYTEVIQPILDRNCVRCHNGRDNTPNLLGTLTAKEHSSKRRFSESYLALTHSRLSGNSTGALVGNPDHPEVNWTGSMSEPEVMEPYSAGSATSRLIRRLRDGHGKLSRREIATIAAWIDLGVPFVGNYSEANDWNAQEMRNWDYYSHKRNVADDEDKKGVEAYVKSLK